MIEPYLSFVLVAFVTFLLCSCVWILGLGAKEWSDAAAAQHRARAHGIEADMQKDTIEHARAAADAAMRGRPAPTPEQIREAILAQRAAGNGMSEGYEEPEYTTSGDVTPDELNEHMQGGEFKQPTS